MQSVPNNKSQQIEKTKPSHNYSVYQKKRLLVLDVKYPIEPVSLPFYCISCRQLCWCWLQGITADTIATYSVKTYAILFASLFLTRIYPLAVWQPLKRYNQKIFSPSQAVRFYFMGCNKAFLNYLPKTTE